MVKADVKRNYYADLELGPNADPSEISKQYRKLGKSSRATPTVAETAR
jgi:curved DNA-binding protein CbpA